MKNDLFKRFMVGTIILALMIGAFSFTACGDKPSPKKPAVEYTVSKGTITGVGNFVIDPGSAKAGATVALKITSGTLKEFILDPSGPVTQVNATNYTFIMPKANVVVSAEFEAGVVPIDEGPYAITKGTVNNPAGDFDIDLLEADEGDTVTLTVTFTDQTYQVDRWTITGNPVVTTVTKDAEYSFIMPGNAVTVSLLIVKEGESLPTQTYQKGYVRLMIDGSPDNRDLTGLVDFTVSPESPAVVGSTVLLTVDIDPAYVYYRFTFVPPAITVEATANPNEYSFTMPNMAVLGINLEVREAGFKEMITEGAITVTAPVTGTVPPAVQSGNLAAPGDKFTAELTAINGTLTGGNYGDGEEYEFVFTLTAEEGWKFLANNPAIAVNGIVAAFTVVDDSTATLKAYFRTPFGPAGPREPDFAYNKTGFSSGKTPYSDAFIVSNMFNGETRAGNAYWSNQHQLNGEGGTNPKFFAVDLGEERSIGTIRLTWGQSDYTQAQSVAGDIEGMTKYDIKIPAAGWTGSPTSALVEGWTVIKSVDNQAFNTPKTSRIREESLEMPAGTKARYIAIMRTATADEGEVNDWPRLMELEVFERGAPVLTPHTVRTVTGLVVPVTGAAVPAIGTAYTAGANYTAKLAAISPSVTGTFAPRTAYTYTVELETSPNYRFVVGDVTINGDTFVKEQVVNEFGYKISVDYKFPETSAAIIGEITFTNPVLNATAPTVNNGNYSNTATFTAQVSSYNPALVGGAYGGGILYQITFALTAVGAYTFPTGDNSVLVNGNGTGTYTYVDATHATVTHTFPSTRWAVTPGATNIVAGFADNTVVSNPGKSQYNDSTPLTMFDASLTTGFQTGDAGNNPTWFAVNLGSLRNVGVIRVYGGPTNPGDGMMNYDVQIKTTAAAPPQAWDDNDWTTIVQVRKTGARGAYYDEIHMPGNTQAWWVRIKRAPGSVSGAGEYTNWHRVYDWQIYAGGAPANAQYTTIFSQ